MGGPKYPSIREAVLKYLREKLERSSGTSITFKPSRLGLKGAAVAEACEVAETELAGAIALKVCNAKGRAFVFDRRRLAKLLRRLGRGRA